MKTLYASPRYRSFVDDRNKALEQINNHAQTDVSRILFERLERITGFISHMGIQGHLEMNHRTLEYISKQLDAYITEQLTGAIPLMVDRITRMRKATFIITYLGELEAIARATKRTTKIMPHQFQDKLKAQLAQPTLLGKPLNVTIWLALSKLKQRIIHKTVSSITLDRTPKEVVDDVKSVYPKAVAYKRPPIALKNLREADNGRGPNDDDDDKDFDFYNDIVSDSDWDLAVSAYRDTELPASRFDNSPNFDPDTGNPRYNWEVEQEMTDDFVNQVRDGQVEAANQLGVQDFVWVSVIDNKTCDECCLPRNGLTLTEIESKLKTGELSEDDCDATSPPAHPNCRCDLAPVADIDEVEGPDWKAFGDWLES